MKATPVYAAPHYGPLQQVAVLDLFEPDHLEQAEALLYQTSPTEELRTALARAIWKRLRSSRPDPRNVKRQVLRLLDMIERSGCAGPAHAEVGYQLKVTGVEAALVRFRAKMKREPDFDDHALMAELVRIYEFFLREDVGYTEDASTKPRSFTGPFIVLVELVERAVAKGLGRKPRTNATIGGIVKTMVQQLNSESGRARFGRNHSAAKV